MLAEGLEAKDAFVGNSIGDAPAVLAGGGKVVTATYAYPSRITPPWSR